ncbi:unnamed protein product [Dicrocoelium dendriticum]|nr:unnamed protein product [Dicrocoelium dendriticum]
MPTFKLVFPSNRAKDGWETTRWNVKQPKESITYDMLVTRLRQIIDTPTSGYAVTWSDGEDVCSIRSTEELQDAIDFFEENQANDKCIRLMAEPVDKIDLFTAMQLYSQLNSSDAAEESVMDVNENTEVAKNNLDTDGDVENNCISAVSSTVSSAVETNNERHFTSTHPVLSIQTNASVNIKPEPLFDDTKERAAAFRLKASRGLFPVVRESRSKRISPAEVKVKDAAPDNVVTTVEQTNGECAKDDLPNTQQPVDKDVEREAQIQPDYFETEALSRTWTIPENTFDLSRQLYMMGFRFDEKTFKRIIRECSGDVNLIIDKLSNLTAE